MKPKLIATKLLSDKRYATNITIDVGDVQRLIVKAIMIDRKFRSKK